MTTTPTSTLVLKNQAGSYFLMPRETLEQGRVPAEHTAEIERLIAEQDDVQGHVVPIGFLVACSLIMLGAELGIGFGDVIAKPLSSDSIAEQMRGR